MGMNNLDIEIVKSPDDAPDYNKIKPEHSTATLEKAVVVRKGTVGKRSTVDLIFTDKHGKKHIAMTTGRILNGLAKVIGDES